MNPDRIDLTQMPEWAAKKFRTAQENPDLIFHPDDSDAEIERKVAEFNALMLAGEPKH